MGLTLTLTPLQELIRMSSSFPLICYYARSVLLSSVYVSFRNMQIRCIRPA